MTAARVRPVVISRSIGQPPAPSPANITPRAPVTSTGPKPPASLVALLGGVEEEQ